MPGTFKFPRAGGCVAAPTFQALLFDFDIPTGQERIHIYRETLFHAKRPHESRVRKKTAFYGVGASEPV